MVKSIWEVKLASAALENEFSFSSSEIAEEASAAETFEFSSLFDPLRCDTGRLPIEHKLQFKFWKMTVFPQASHIQQATFPASTMREAVGVDLTVLAEERISSSLTKSLSSQDSFDSSRESSKSSSNSIVSAVIEALDSKTSVSSSCAPGFEVPQAWNLAR